MINNISPLWVLENGEIEKGEVGLLVGAKSSGKSKCITNIGIEKILNGKSILHVSLEDLPDKISDYYRLKVNELVKFTGKREDLERIENKRIILSYLSKNFKPEKLDNSIRNLKENGYSFDVLLLDGLETEKISVLKEIKKIATNYQLEVWISFSSENYLKIKEELKKVCNCVIRLISHKEDVYVTLEEKDVRLNLDPTTLFVKSLKS